MQAIETHYAGYRFRSRLEARWAVFFDVFGLAYRYEPEGFELEGGGRYLPDFYLPDLRAWAEVKGQYRAGDLEKTSTAAWDLIYAGDTFLFLGDTFRQPRKGVTLPWAVRFYTGDDWGGDLIGAWEVGTPDVLDDSWGGWGGCSLAEFPGAENLERGVSTSFSALPDTFPLKQFQDASRAAQQARFEFGETPGRGL